MSSSLDEVGSLAPLYGVGPCGVGEVPQHGPRLLVVGDDQLQILQMQGPLASVDEPVRLDPLGEDELDADEVDVLLGVEKVRMDDERRAPSEILLTTDLLSLYPPAI